MCLESSNGEVRQEDWEFKASLACLVSLCLNNRQNGVLEITCDRVIIILNNFVNVNCLKVKQVGFLTLHF